MQTIETVSLPNNRTGFMFIEHYEDRQRLTLPVLEAQLIEQLRVLDENPDSKAVTIAVVHGVPALPFGLDTFRSAELEKYKQEVRKKRRILALLVVQDSSFVRAFSLAAAAYLGFEQGGKVAPSEDEAKKMAYDILSQAVSPVG